MQGSFDKPSLDPRPHQIRLEALVASSGSADPVQDVPSDPCQAPLQGQVLSMSSGWNSAQEG